MAGERKGEGFECLICLALQNLGYSLNKDFFWGEKPEGFSVDPDFIIGDLSAPTHWILATSSGSAKNSLEKFWRNLGEIFEVKRNFETPPKILNLVFETNLRDALQKAMSSISDSELLLEHFSYGSTLQCFIDDLINEFPDSREDKILYINRQIQSCASISDAFKQFQDELEETLSIENSQFNRLWKLLRTEDRNCECREAKDTFLRRGIAKIMTLPKSLRTSLYSHVLHRGRLRNLPNHFHALGYARRSLVGSVITDPEILWAIKNISQEDLEYIITTSYSARPKNWQNWNNILHETNISENQIYLEENYEELITPGGMEIHLINHAPEGYKWLFAHLMEILKMASGKRQGYGYSVLSRDVGYTKGISQGYLELSDWVNGLIESPRNPTLLSDVATALASRLANIPFQKLQQLGSSIEKEYFHNLMETKIISYWLFEPLPLLIYRALKDLNLPFEDIKKHPTFIGEYLGEPTRIASPRAIRVSNTLIGWRSAYDSGKHHKAKEMAGRAQARRYEFDGQTFRKRQGVEQLIMLVDGTFTSDQLTSLYNAGWDYVFYPDEMDSFKSRIL